MPRLNRSGMGLDGPAKQRNDVRGSKNLLKLTEDVNSG